MQRTMHALSISEKYTEALVKRLHQNDSIRSLLLSRFVASLHFELSVLSVSPIYILVLVI